MILTSKQRAYLRSLAQKEETIFQIGKGGITEEICAQLSNALEARELIKVKVLDNSEYSAAEAMETIASAIGAVAVGTVGNKFVLFRPSQKKRRITLP